MITRTRAALTAVAAIAVETAAGTIGALALLITAFGGWCSDNDTPTQCSARQHQADVDSIVVAAIVIPLVFGLVTLTVRAVGGDAVGRLGWLRLVALVAALVLAPALAVALGVMAYRLTEHSGWVAVGALAVSLGAELAGWAALLRAAVNRRGRLTCKDGV